MPPQRQTRWCPLPHIGDHIQRSARGVKPCRQCYGVGERPVQSLCCRWLVCMRPGRYVQLKHYTDTANASFAGCICTAAAAAAAELPQDGACTPCGWLIDRNFRPYIHHRCLRHTQARQQGGRQPRRSPAAPAQHPGAHSSKWQRLRADGFIAATAGHRIRAPAPRLPPPPAVLLPNHQRTCSRRPACWTGWFAGREPRQPTSKWSGGLRARGWAGASWPRPTSSLRRCARMALLLHPARSLLAC